MINELNIQRNNLNSIYEKFETLKIYHESQKSLRNLSYIKIARISIKEDLQEVLERKTGFKRTDKDDIQDRQEFKSVPLKPPVVFLKPPPPTPIINPSIFIPNVFGKSCKEPKYL